jgi:hypothetical protein
MIKFVQKIYIDLICDCIKNCQTEKSKEKNMTSHQDYINIRQIINFTYIYNQIYTF